MPNAQWAAKLHRARNEGEGDALPTEHTPPKMVYRNRMAGLAKQTLLLTAFSLLAPRVNGTCPMTTVPCKINHSIRTDEDRTCTVYSMLRMQ
jgi:hypothetical protein